MCFPFGLETLPPLPTAKDDALFFANRGLEPIYAPQRVIDAFAAIAARGRRRGWWWPTTVRCSARCRRRREALGLQDQVRFVGRLDAAAQAGHYARARWYFSLPRSDSVSVSVLEAMAHGCVPLLSDLPANRELVRSGDNGLILADGATPVGRRAAAAAGTRRRHCPRQPRLGAPARHVRPLRAGLPGALARAAGGMNILLLNHYAGTPALGMEFRPYYMAREWVRQGHRVQIVAADYSHVRARQPTAGDELIDGIAYRWVATPPYRGNGLGRVRNIWAFLRARVGRHAPAAARVPARRGHRLQHLPDGHLGGAAPGAAGRREAGVRGARPVAAVADRAVGHVALAPVHPPGAGGRGRRLPRCRRGGVDAAQGARLHGLARAGPAQAAHRAQRHRARRLAAARRSRCATTWRRRWPRRARPAARWSAMPARWACPTRWTRCSTRRRCCAAWRCSSCWSATGTRRRGWRGAWPTSSWTT